MNTNLMQNHPGPAGLARPTDPGPAKPPPALSHQPALPTSLIELILAHVPHVSPQPDPTYIFALMVLPPSVVPLAFKSIVHIANRRRHTLEPIDNDDGLNIVDPLLCVSRLARPSPVFPRLFEMVAPVLRSLAAESNGRDDTSDDDVIDRMLIGLCKHGNLEGLKLFHANNVVDLSVRPIYKYMTAASEGGFVAILDWWMEAVTAVEQSRRDRKRTGLPSHPYDEPEAACIFGHWDVVQWWNTYKLRPVGHYTGPHLLAMCRHGRVQLLFNAWLELGAIMDQDDPDYMDEASAAGHVEVLDWIITHVQSPSYTHRAMDEASRNGHLHVLDWWARSGLSLKFTSLAKVDAARAGRTEIVNWWISLPLYRTLLCSSLLPNSPAPKAVQATDLVTLASFGALAWIRDALVDTTFDMEISDTSAFYQVIARSGHVHIMCEYDSHLYTNDDLEPCLELAAQYDNVHVWRFLVDELYTEHDADPNFSTLWTSCALIAAEHESMDVLEILMINVKTRPFAQDFPKVVVAACKGGSEKVLQYLIDNKYWTGGSLSEADQQAALESAAAHGRVGVLKWWYSRSEQRSPLFLALSQSWVNELAGAACQNGHVAVLDWLVDTFGKQSFTIPSRHVQAVGIKKDKCRGTIDWLLTATAQETISVSAASQAYLKMALDSQ